jgi:hypothetical protein
MKSVKSIKEQAFEYKRRISERAPAICRSVKVSAFGPERDVSPLPWVSDEISL